MTDPIRRTANSSVTIELIHPRAIKLIQSLDDTDRGMLREKLSKPIIATDYKMYRGDHVRRAQLFHTHVSKNLVFNFLLEAGVGVLVFIGMHKKAEHHADNFRNTINLSDCVSIHEAQLWVSAAKPLATPEASPPSEEPVVTPAREASADLRDIANLLDNAIQSVVKGQVEEATANLHKHYDAVLELVETAQAEQKKSREELEAVRGKLAQLGTQLEAQTALAEQAKRLSTSFEEHRTLAAKTAKELQAKLAEHATGLERTRDLEARLTLQTGQLDTLRTQAAKLVSLEAWQTEQQHQTARLESLTSQQASLLEQHQQLAQVVHDQSEKTRDLLSVVSRLLDDTILDVKNQKERNKVQAEELGELRGLWEQSAVCLEKKFQHEQQQRERLELQLTEADEHINILNEQIQSQAAALARGEQHRHDLEVLLHRLEIKVRELSERPPEPTTFTGRMKKLFLG